MKNIIRQKKKAALQEFLFGSQDSIAPTLPSKDLEAKIEKLQNEINSLQQKAIHVENQTNNFNDASKYLRRGRLNASDGTKTIPPESSERSEQVETE